MPRLGGSGGMGTDMLFFSGGEWVRHGGNQRSRERVVAAVPVQRAGAAVEPRMPQTHMPPLCWQPHRFARLHLRPWAILPAEPWSVAIEQTHARINRDDAWTRLDRPPNFDFPEVMKMQQMKDVMSRSVHLVSPDATLKEAAALMRDKGFGMLPVSENDRMIGTITDRDIAIRGVAEGKTAETTVREVMTKDLVWAYEEETVEQGASKMKLMRTATTTLRLLGRRLVGNPRGPGARPPRLTP